MEKSGGKFVLEWETHSKQISKGLCMLMERQCLVDIAVCCGSNTLHAHKCVLAASSSYFKEHLENKAIEQVVINGLDFAVMKSLIEFMYCGECSFSEDHLKHFIAAVKFFKIVALENVFAENEYQNVAEESFNETTVENFIPNVEENYVENIHEVQFVNGNSPQVATNGKSLSVIPVSSTQGLTTDKIKHILGNDKVEIMFQTSDGNFVNLSDEVLLNLSKGGIQYQVVDENGHIGEVQELKTLDNASIPNKAANMESFHDDSSLKREENFDLQIVKNPEEIDKLAKAIPEEYIDPSFSSAACNKNNIETLQLHEGFSEDIYENSFHMQSSEIFEPENLSMHSDLMEHNPMEFATVNDLKYKYVAKINSLKNSSDTITLSHHDIITKVNGDTNQDSSGESNEVLVMETDTVKTTQNKSSLKFTPDMFFAELPGNTCTEDKSEIPAESDGAK
ncbi:uncharacterized protein LOC135126906 isoform X2 [Zophobas morio]|uniref:uncharacterized protein LOC135126906 isoform X2 n=1 Tax=Zophobas morio TaxID=2755281 RepID=UPI003082E291